MLENPTHHSDSSVEFKHIFHFIKKTTHQKHTFLPLLRFGWMLVHKYSFLLGFVRGVWQLLAVITHLTITVISKSSLLFLFLNCWSETILIPCLSREYLFFQIQSILHYYYSLICLICLICRICFCLHRDTFVLCLLNGGTSFVAGFAIFSVLGFMSYEQGLPISEVAATGKTIAAYGL